MKIKNKKIIESFFIAGILSILLVSLVIAGVSNPYGINPLEMYPGEIKDVTLTLQNLAGGGDVTYDMEVTEGSEIASIKDSSNRYLVPLGDNNVKVNLKVEIPETATIGSEYSIKVRFSPVSVEEGEATGASVLVGFGAAIIVKVIGKPQPPEIPSEEKISPVWIILGIVAVIAVIVVLWFIVKSKKESSAEKSKTVK